MAEAVTVSRGNRRLLDAVTLAIRPGEVLALLGPNGAGKSTLVNVFAGDLVPDRGGIRCDGVPLTALSEAEQARYRAVMAQAAPPVFGFTVEDVVGMGWVADGTADACALRRLVRSRLHDCGIDHLVGRAFNSLSGGEQQRASFARALVQLGDGADRRGAYLLLDEPTSNLDLVHQQALLEVAVCQARSGTGVLVVLHDLNLAARFADRVALLKDGRLICCDAPPRALSASRLSELYGMCIHVEHHPTLDRLVVLA